MSALSFLLFTALSIVWITSLCFDVLSQPRLGHSWYFYKLVMLTNLNFVLDVAYSVVVLLGYKSNKMKEVADFMHFTSFFPVGMVTCGLFWGLYTIDPALVMPEWIAKLIPMWLNHITHTFPLIYTLLDSYFHKRTAPNKTTCWVLSAIFVLFYLLIIGYVKYFDGFWLYPLLNMFTLQHFVISYVFAVVGFFLLTRAACLLNEMFHGKPVTKKIEKIVKTKKQN